MDLYMKFVTMLAVGLSGLGVFLVVIMDELLLDYDAPAAFSQWMKERLEQKRRASVRAEDLMLEVEKAKMANGGSMRLIDQRREELRELASVERRLQGPARQGPVVLEPLKPVPAAAE